VYRPASKYWLHIQSIVYRSRIGLRANYSDCWSTSEVRYDDSTRCLAHTSAARASVLLPSITVQGPS